MDHTYNQYSLRDKRILVTRSRPQASELSELIRRYGGIPIECPLITIRTPKERGLIRETIDRLEQFDWIVLTSVNGVERFFDLVTEYKDVDLSRLNTWKWAVVGEKTRKVLENKGIKADLMPDVYEASHLYAELVKQLDGDESILLARGNLANKELVCELEKHGFRVADLIVYETMRNESSRDMLYHLIKKQELDMITFTSPSTVRHFIELLEGTEWRSDVEGVKIACIGPVTAREAEDMSFTVSAVASPYTAEGLVNAILRTKP